MERKEQYVPPLCSIHNSLTDQGVIEALELDRGTFAPVFEALQKYWDGLRHLPSRYSLCSLRQMRRVLNTPEEWFSVGTHLADATLEVWGNGSDQFLEHAVTGLVESGIATSPEELVAGIDGLLQTVNSRDGQTGRWRYDGGHDYVMVGHQMRTGEITSLEDLRRLWPGSDTI